MRRVVITGMGLVTSLGHNLKSNWEKLISSKSGISLIDSFDVDDLPSKIGGTIHPDVINKNFSAKDKRKMDNFILYAMIAASEAIENSGWIVNNEIDSSRTGVIVGSGIGGLSTIYNNSILLLLNSFRRMFTLGV